MPPLNEAVTSRIRTEMYDQGVSARRLAQLMNVERMYLQRRLLGEVEFRPSDLEEIAAALGVPVTRFLADQPAVTP